MSAGTKRISNGDNTTATEETNDVDTAIVDGGPGLVYMPFVVMEDLLDKLKLLNYEEVSQPNFFQTCIHSHYLVKSNLFQNCWHHRQKQNLKIFFNSMASDTF